MASRAAAVLALAGLGIAAAGFAVVDALMSSWSCVGSGCAAPPSGALVIVSAGIAALGLVLGGISATRWLLSTAPRREWTRTRRDRG